MSINNRIDNKIILFTLCGMHLKESFHNTCKAHNLNNDTIITGLHHFA